MSSPRKLIPVLAALAAIALAGCGVGGDERDARTVTNRFLTALSKHDGEAACRQLSQDAVKKLIEQNQQPCKQAVLSLKLDGSSAGNVRVYINTGRATVAGGDRLYLDRGPNGWKVSSAGCKPQPDRQPDDCDLED